MVQFRFSRKFEKLTEIGNKVTCEANYSVEILAPLDANPVTLNDEPRYPQPAMEQE